MEIFVLDDSPVPARRRRCFEAKKRWGAIYGRGEDARTVLCSSTGMQLLAGSTQTLSLEIDENCRLPRIRPASIQTDLRDRIGAGCRLKDHESLDVPGRATEHHLSTEWLALLDPDAKRERVCPQRSPSSDRNPDHQRGTEGSFFPMS